MKNSTVLDLQYSPMQFSDTDEQMAHDIDLLFGRGARILGGSEAGGEKSKPMPDLLRAACERFGYRFHIGRGDWIAVDEDLVAGGWREGYVPVLESTDGAGRHTDRGIPWVSFETRRLGRVTVGVGHFLTNGRDPGDVNYEWNVRYAAAVGEWAREHGRGDGVVFWMGDVNTPDRSYDVLRGAPLTTLGDALEDWQNTGHGPIDVIATYDRDGRVSAVSLRVLDDSELRLHTDHFVSVGRVRVRHVRERFDAAGIAAEAVARGEDPVASVVGQALGAASACWDNLSGAGVFESDRCKAILDAVLDWLEPQVRVADQMRESGRLVEPLGPGQRLVLRLTGEARVDPAHVAQLRTDLAATTGVHGTALVVAEDIEAYVVDADAIDVEAVPGE